jgi:hypothetical protein
MLDGEGECVALTSEIEIGFAPGVELGGAAQRLARPGAAGTLLGMVDDEHGKLIPVLQLAQ